MEGVEGVKEFLLGTLLSGDELDVVDQQYVDGAISRPKFHGGVVADGVYEFVCERFGGHIKNAEGWGGGGEYVVTDRLHEVGLAEADASVYEERVVSRCGGFGNGKSCGVGEAIAVADDERIERVLGVELIRVHVVVSGIEAGGEQCNGYLSLGMVDVGVGGDDESQ